MLNMLTLHRAKRRQRGVAAVEFAIIAMLLFTLLFGIIELGRLFYVINTVQEVTRRAAREAVVRWTDDQDEAISLALFGGASLPAGAEIAAGNIDIEYLTAAGAVPSPFPTNPGNNIAACISLPDGCIAYVRVSISGATYAPMVSFFKGIEVTAFPFSEADPFRLDFRIPIPASTVTMPAESMGYTG